MADELTSIDGLTVLQRQACRLEVIGTIPSEIASKLGVHPSTVSKWRGQPLYREHVEALQTEADRDTLRSARRVRGKALSVVEKGLDRALSAISDEDTTTHSEATAMLREGLSAYRAVSAQTGLAESSKIDLSGPGVTFDLRGLSADDLHALAAPDDG